MGAMVDRITGPVACERTRTPDGRYAAETDACGVTTVLIPGPRFAYRVGPKGRIYADYEVAKRHAAERLARFKGM